MVSAISERLELSEVILKEFLDLCKEIRELSDEEILSGSSERAENLFLKLEKSGDKVFFLGSGPLPLTLIVFFRCHEIKVIGIEEDPARASLSIRVLSKLSLSEDITIITGSHLSINPIDFVGPDAGTMAFMIAAQAEPKKEILDHLLKVISPGCKISYRSTKKA